MVRFTEVPDGGLPYADLYLFLATADGESVLFQYKPNQLKEKYNAAYDVGRAKIGFLEYINKHVAWGIVKETDTAHCDKKWLKAILQKFVGPWYEDKEKKEVAIFITGSIDKFERKAFNVLNFKNNYNFNVYIIDIRE